jgi:hypothetical protein
MAAILQIPATVDVTLVRGDEFSWSMVFSADLTSYTFTAGIYNASLTTYASIVTPSLTVTVSSSTPKTTTIVASVVETQTGSLLAAGNYRWWLRWVSPGGVTRTVVSGQFIANAP